MKITILPKTKDGKHTGIFLITAFVALVFAGIKAIMGQPFPEVVELLYAMIIGTLVLFLISLAIGIKAIRKAEERSLLVFFIILIDLIFIIILSLLLTGVLVSP